jgi:REP element-mobilizing transposase RayT
MEYKGWHSRGYLPHLDSPVKTQFITFRTYGSLPKHIYEAIHESLKETTHEDNNWDSFLDQSASGNFLSDPNTSQIVMDSLLKGESLGHYELYAWAVMSNHVHILLRPLEPHTIPQIMKAIKSPTSRQISKLLGIKPPIWEMDYFDRYIRDPDHFAKTVNYIESNPRKAGLSEDYLYVSKTNK